MINLEGRACFGDDHHIFRESVRRFFKRCLLPQYDDFEKNGVSREFWRKCGEAGLLCPTVAPEYGGAGVDFSYNAIIDEELGYHVGTILGIALQSDIVAPYLSDFGTEEQKRRFLPALVTGEIITAIAMTEPEAGSDLQGLRMTARRKGGAYILDGAKTYITNGCSADLVLVAARTSAERGTGSLSLFLVEADMPGFSRGRRLDKIGQHSGDTSELFFDNVQVPAANRLGEEGMGLQYLMSQLPQERLSLAVNGQGAAQRAFDEAVNFTRERKAFGRAILDFQNSRFTLAGLRAELQVGWAHLDWTVQRHIEGRLTAQEASAAKLWHTELQGRVCDASLQLHGGAGYMNEYVIARLWRDARVTRIFGGTNEIMRELVGRSL